MRAATAAEIAASYAIRREFAARSRLDEEFIDHLLKWSNGLAGKMDRLLIPLTMRDKSKAGTMRELKKAALDVSAKRNAIVHQGEFCNEDEATKCILQAKSSIEGLVRVYNPKFKINDAER